MAEPRHMEDEDDCDYEDFLNATERNDNFNTTINVEKLPSQEQLELKRIENAMKEHISGRGGERYQWSLSDFQTGKPLGRGQFGHVYLAREKKTKLVIALKTLIKKEMIKSSRMQLQVVREIEIQTHVKHPNILKLFTYFHDDKRIYLVLEYAGGGELFTKLQNQLHQRFSERRAAKYTYQVTDALEFCHKNDIMHRDIKPENLLLDINDNIKLADFGWSVHAPSNKRKTKCGTLDYLPPEMVEEKAYSNFVDNWCLGVLCYEFLTGRPPFESDEEQKTFKKIVKIEVSYPPHMTPGSIDLISKLLKYKPEERLSFTGVKTHEWLVTNKKKFENNE